MDGQMEGRTDGWTNGWSDGSFKEPMQNQCVDLRSSYTSVVNEVRATSIGQPHNVCKTTLTKVSISHGGDRIGGEERGLVQGV